MISISSMYEREYSVNLLRLMLLRHLELPPAPSLRQLYRLLRLSARQAVVLKTTTRSAQGIDVSEGAY